MSKGHTRETFEAKTLKRGFHMLAAKEVQAVKATGNVVSLTGPCVKEHYQAYKSLLGKGNFFYVAEIDLHTLTSGQMIEQIGELAAKGEKIAVFPGDVFDLLRKLANGERTSQKLVLLDLDFCATAKKLTDSGLEKQLQWLMKSGLLRRQGFYLELTLSMRNRGKLDAEKLISRIINMFTRAGWTWDIHRSLVYKEGSPMRYTLFKFHYPTSQYAKKWREKKKQSTT